jgi:hypothetical protein
MKNARFYTGIALMTAAALNFFFNGNDYYTPATITLLIIGISLVGTSRRMRFE